MVAKKKSSVKHKAIPLPYLAAAVICEKTLQEADKVVTVMRIIDTIGVDAPEFDVAKKKSLKEGKGLMMTMPLTLYLCFRRGNTVDDLPFQINYVDPNKKVHKRAVFGTLHFKGDFSQGYGINIFVPLHIAWERPGLYWYEIEVAGNVITRVPLIVKDATKEQPPKAEAR